MKFINTLMLLVALVLLSTQANCLPFVDVSYAESNANGLWAYELTFSNNLDPTIDYGKNMYSVRLDFDHETTPVLINSPDLGWEYIFGSNFAEFFSVNPGTPDQGGSDIAPSSQLAGFLLAFNEKINPPNFFALLTNPCDEFCDPISYEDKTHADTPSPVPEPSTMMMVIIGIISLVVVRYRYRLA